MVVSLFQLRSVLEGEQVAEGGPGAERAEEAEAQVEARDEGRAQGDPPGHGVRRATQGQGGACHLHSKCSIFVSTNYSLFQVCKL